MNNENRKNYLDILRILASCAVIVLHVSSQNWENVPYNSFEWNTFVLYSGAVRWGVPMFIMISGALFLSRDLPIKVLYKKYILRILFVFLFWTLIYGAFNYIKGWKFNDLIPELFTGHYHMWYLFLIVGLYMIVPILKTITRTEKMMKYFLGLSLIFGFILPYLVQILSLFSNRSSTIVKTMLDDFDLRFLAGYTFYFVLGYFLSIIELPRKHVVLICLCGLVALVLTIAGTLFLSYNSGTKIGWLFNNLSVNVMLISTALFVLFKHLRERKISNSPRVGKIVILLSKYSFGIYLVHVLVMEFMTWEFNYTTLSLNPLVSIPLNSLIIFSVSFIISCVLNYIPVLKKFV